MFAVILCSVLAGVCVTLLIELLLCYKWTSKLPVVVPSWKPQTEPYVLPAVSQSALLGFVIYFIVMCLTTSVEYSSCASTLLIGWQEGHPALKNTRATCPHGFTLGTCCLGMGAVSKWVSV